MYNNSFAIATDAAQKTEQTNTASKKDSSSILGKNELGRDEFLKLFVEQLKNQDPMNPMENYEVAAQLAQYSSLEQLVNINNNFDKFLGAMSLNSYFQGLNLLGKSIEYTGNKFEYNPEENQKIKINFDLQEDARNINVNIYDENNNYIRTLTLDNAEKGENNVEWDGVDKLGNKMKAGLYHYEIVAYNNEGENVQFTPYGKGVVKNISFDKKKSEAIITVNGDNIDITDIKSVNN